MVKPQIIEEKPISMVELKQEIDKIKKRDEEPGFRVNKTEEFLNQFVKLDKTKEAEIKKRIEAIGIPRIKPEHINKIVDLLPAFPEEVKLLFQGSIITITNENAKKISDTVKEYVEEK